MATTAPAATVPTMRPYRRRGAIDYARLDYEPDEPVLKPDAMEQEQPMQEFLGLLASRFTDFGQRPDTFLSSNTIICYDPHNLNVRVSPDVYLAFGVDAQAIRRRKLYLPLGSVATERASRRAAEAERDAARLENERLRAQLRRRQAGR